MTKFKELGTNQGVRITRPWNDEMYAHNDKVAYHQHVAIKAALTRASKNEVDLRVIAKAINASPILIWLLPAAAATCALYPMAILLEDNLMQPQMYMHHKLLKHISRKF